MALRLLESFDHATATYYDLKYTDFAAAIDAAGRTGSCAKANAPWPNIKKVFADSQQGWVFGCAWKRPSTGDYLVGFFDAGSAQVYVKYDTSDHKFKVYRNLTLLGSSAAGLVLAGVWYYVEFKLLIANAVGTFELRLDGRNILSAINQDTQETANASANEVRMLGANSMYMDDLYLCDGTAGLNDFLGDIKVVRLKPNGAGTYSEWTPSAGANWQNVDEDSPDADATFNSTDVLNERDTYAFEDVVLTGSVKGVQLNLCYRKDDAGARKVKPLCRSGGADFEGTEDTVDNTYRYNQPAAIYQSDPATGLAWTVPGLNAAEFGLKLTA